MARGLTRHCAGHEEYTEIAQVVAALEQIRDDPDTPGGIAAFTKLYEIITRNVMVSANGRGKREFADRDFLIELDLQFARRYFRAIEAWNTGGRPPACWAVLFDADDGAHGDANFAACGVNAHVDFDLAFALLETWKTFPPTEERREDYKMVNRIFRDEMDGLRELFPTEMSEGDDGGPIDRAGNWLSSLLVVYTRSLAWDAAMDVWEARRESEDAYTRAHAQLEDWLDAVAHLLGAYLLKRRWVP